MHKSRKRLPFAAAALIGAALALAACGSAVRTVPLPTVSPSTAGSTPVTSPSPGSSLITLTPAQARNAPSQPISITVHNGLSSPIYTLDIHTGCTIIQLQLASGGGWQPIGACVMEQPHPHVVQIAPGASLGLQLVPGQEANLPLRWPPGTYRAALTYTTSASGAIGQGPTVYSASFLVG